MLVESISSVDEFLKLSESLRQSDPLRTNIIGSVATAVSTGQSIYEACRWIVVRDDKGVVIGCAMRTSPLHLAIAPIDESAVGALAAFVATNDDWLPGFSAILPVAASFLRHYLEGSSAGSLRRSREVRRDRLYELRELAAPNVVGHARRARREDLDTLVRWQRVFLREVDLRVASEDQIRASLTAMIDVGFLWVWEDDDVLCSYAGHAPIVQAGTSRVARVGPVFTPPKLRGRGYASGVTAAASHELVDTGARVILYTDAANATSNRIYQRLGYEFIEESCTIEFDATGATD